MPGLDGTGPSGQGPLTGKGQGFCILKRTEEQSGQVKGFVGLQGTPVEQRIENIERVNTMPRGDGTGPGAQGPGTGRGTGRGRRGRPFAAGPGGSCICLNCGVTAMHAQGQPCNEKGCPKCGHRMIRA